MTRPFVDDDYQKARANHHMRRNLELRERIQRKDLRITALSRQVREMRERIEQLEAELLKREVIE